MISLSLTFVNKKTETLDENETIFYNRHEVMDMNSSWENATVTKISIAIYVLPNINKQVHQDRPFHGLVLDDEECVKDYVFSDGRVMRTEGGAFFYLPKGSSYCVKPIRAGGCYAINFDAAGISDEPFCLLPHNREKIFKHFKAAANAWKSGDALCHALATRAVYEAICQIRREQTCSYVPQSRYALIEPALAEIKQHFASDAVSVSRLASLCGVSEVYFRRVFLSACGCSPKEYIIKRRMDYAKTLLRAGGFSVAEVASLCGYAEPSHFSREFSRRVGISPTLFAASKKE